MTRWRASGLHLLASCAIAGTVILLVIFLWYPGAYFQASGAARLITILIAVDVVIGPMLTLFLYRAGKPGLAFDMTTVFITQLAFLIYGLVVIVQTRPVFIVGAIDRLVVVPASQIDPADLPTDPNDPFRKLSWTGPVPVGLNLPTDVKARNELLFKEIAGKPSEAVPRLYVPYSQVAATLIERGRTIDTLRVARERTPGVLQKWLDGSERPPEQLLWLPLQARKQDMVVIIDKNNAEPLVILDIEPW